MDIWSRLQRLQEEDDECEKLLRYMATLDMDVIDQNKMIAIMNNELFDRYPNDISLQNALMQKEAIVYKKRKLEERVFEECRENIYRKQKEIDEKRQEIKEEMERENQKNESYYNNEPITE